MPTLIGTYRDLKTAWDLLDRGNRKESIDYFVRAAEMMKSGSRHWTCYDSIEAHTNASNYYQLAARICEEFGESDPSYYDRAIEYYRAVGIEDEAQRVAKMKGQTSHKL